MKDIGNREGIVMKRILINRIIKIGQVIFIE